MRGKSHFLEDPFEENKPLLPLQPDASKTKYESRLPERSKTTKELAKTQQDFLTHFKTLRDTFTPTQS